MFKIGSDSDTAAVYRARFARRLPASLSELTGPEHGLVELPLHVAWSGLRELDWTGPVSA
jgi:hypothetical protein